MHDEFVIEPDQLLETLPFSALVDRQGKFLAEKADLSFSAGLLYLRLPNAKSTLRAQSRALVVADQSSHPGIDLPRLPDAESEARLVTGIFKNSIVVRGGESVISTVEKELPQVELFHFSGHAVLDANSSRLIIGTEQNGGVGVLGAEQIQRIRLKNTRLVVLSACSTAQGPVGVFSDSDSVARSFISAGAWQVVASRWPVESRATAQLMDTFYRSILDGRGTSRALTHAQIQLLGSKDKSHPFYWAAFSVFGNV
jgi:CHAT domain-containing protein